MTEMPSKEQAENTSENATTDSGQSQENAAADSGQSQENSEQSENSAEAADAAEESKEETQEPEDFRDKYLRAMADLENFRMRVRREKANWTQDAVRGMAVDLIDILDNLNLALTTTEKNEAANDETFLRGVKAVRDQLTNSLSQRGIKAIEAKPGDAFDPDCHEVLLSQDDESVVGQQVGIVLRAGYKLDKQVLRPAQIQLIRGRSE